MMAILTPAQGPAWRRFAPLLFIAAMAILPFVLPGRFWLHIFSLTMIYAIFVLGQNVITGWAGMLTLGQAAFAGTGAYVSVILTMQFGVPWLLAFLIAGGASAGAGALLALPCLRVKSDFLSLVTIAFNQIFFVVANNWMDVTRGPMGIPAVPAMNVLGWRADRPAEQFWLILGVCVILYAMISRLMRGQLGRTLKMVRDDEVAAGALGVNVTGAKVLAFAIGCGLCGLGGSIYGHYMRFISPDMFKLEESLIIMQMAILGGLASAPGAALGAFLMIMIPEALRSSEPWLITIRPGVAGATLVLLMILRPHGLLGMGEMPRSIQRLIDRAMGRERDMR
ncbi:branched-chain amino acid ABC transporter permease [Rhodophyticola sp. CCM32]|uniref:branched-chain amino acid ABC transporter permease n=1 Tax=Rhodophyticola sp. CCM32 TaxID=2916397 RepID=UPI00107F0BEB|nr:branched-chain amino acid ABC transporter permease [Rhodophyticola sp. CCM32]QBY00078.1 branched-chain amino acid ABC transporter permease [Rhodophyticola sp. CCM32]